MIASGKHHREDQFLPFEWNVGISNRIGIPIPSLTGSRTMIFRKFTRHLSDDYDGHDHPNRRNQTRGIR